MAKPVDNYVRDGWEVKMSGVYNIIVSIKYNSNVYGLIEFDKMSLIFLCESVLI